LGEHTQGNAAALAAAERDGEVVARDDAYWKKKTPEQQKQEKAEAAEAKAHAKRALAEAKVAESKQKELEFEQAKMIKAAAAAAAQQVLEEDAAGQARATLRQRQDRASFMEHNNKAEAANVRAAADADAAVARLVEKKRLEQAGIGKRPPRARAAAGSGLASGAAAKRSASSGRVGGKAAAGSEAGSRSASRAGSRTPLRSASADSVGSKARFKKSDVENI
jgi:hypothetical protein